MKLPKILGKPPWKIPVAMFLLVCIFLAGYQIWDPGMIVTDGSHDLGTNGMWLQHAWLGDDEWFKTNNKKTKKFRDRKKIRKLKDLLVEHHITDLFPHLCPCSATGDIPKVDPEQTQRFMDVMGQLRVIPWVGGIQNVHVFLDSPKWRERFIQSTAELLKTYPEFSGVHVNIEPLPSGTQSYVTLLRDLKRRLPPGKILSIAAYPPPTILHPTLNVHWKKDFFKAVAGEVNQTVVMMYDSSLRFQKLYRNLMTSWTGEIIEWAGNTDVLLGIPVYDDKWGKYHNSHVENLENSLSGIHAGLSRYTELPPQYKGIAIYCEWEMEPEEWGFLKKNYVSK